MKNKITAKHIFTALSIFCAVGSAASFFTNDIGIAVLILLPLCGFFAWFGLKWYGFIVVAAAGVINSLIGNLQNVRCDTVGEWITEILFSIEGSTVFIIIGLVGFFTALLFSAGFGKEYAGKKFSRVIRPLAAAGAILIVFAAVNFIMIFTGDPITYCQTRIAADCYVSEKYPDEGYELDNFEFNFKEDTYTYYYLRKDIGFQPYLEINVRSDNSVPVARYFSSFTISETFSVNYYEGIN